jgi:TRAP-type mannitol/chloroaromatic compound transport system substrate-binding protein
MFVVQSGGHNTFAEVRDGFGNGAHALFIFRSEKKRPQERAVDAVAESEFRAAHPFEQVFWQGRNAKERGLENVVPFFGRIARGHR